LKPFEVGFVFNNFDKPLKNKNKL